MSDFKNRWEYDLSDSEKHLALYSKGHYRPTDHGLIEDLITIYQMNSGGILIESKKSLMAFLHKTLIKMIGPERFAFRSGNFIPEVFDERKRDIPGYPSDLFEGFLCEISNSRVRFDERPAWLHEDRSLDMLGDVEPQIIKRWEDQDNNYTLYPKRLLRVNA